MQGLSSKGRFLDRSSKVILYNWYISLFVYLMNRQITITAALLGMLAVILGAFGAHGLKAIVSPSHLDTWHTAVQYHFYHVFALLFLAVSNLPKSKAASVAYYCFLLGILCFSGSLYLLTLMDLNGMAWVRGLGPVTPLGGLFFIIGWVALAVAAYKAKQ
jgi:uncharacterized membrane protein YgdD (TMEM256/DUF423 family)